MTYKKQKKQSWKIGYKSQVFKAYKNKNRSDPNFIL